MSKYTLHAEELAATILETLRSSGMLKEGCEHDQSVVETLSGLMVNAGFPDKDVLTKDITILLSDIRGFSEITEAYPARDVVALLNRYFDGMSGMSNAEIRGGTTSQLCISAT